MFRHTKHVSREVLELFLQGQESRFSLGLSAKRAVGSSVVTSRSLAESSEAWESKSATGPFFLFAVEALHDGDWIRLAAGEPAGELPEDFDARRVLGGFSVFLSVFWLML